MKVALVLVLAASLAPVATAHPLGNFTTNRQGRLALAPGRLDVRYVVDLAELPAYRELAAMDTNGDGTADDTERATWAARMAGDVARELRVTVDDAPVALGVSSADAATVPGAGGLLTLRLEVALASPIATHGTVVVRDDNFAGLPGWQEILVVPSAGVALERSSVASVDRTDGLRRYPADVLAAPPQVREARFTYAPGVATAALPAAETGSVRAGAERFGDRLTAIIADPRPLSAGVVLAGLLVAAVLGAFHALTPGHGKTIVGAHLVGSRGTWRHAVLLGLVVTATHTLGVYALGAATLVASAWVLPERLLPWLSAMSGLLVVAVGASLLRSRLETALHGHAHEHGHAHHHHHGHHHGYEHGHRHLPAAGAAPSLRSLVALGVSGGILPCPSALVVMLGAIALGRTGFGLVLILAFSTGLAAVLTGIGLALVYARGLFDRLPLDGRLARYMPVASAAVISLAGLAIVAEALVRIGA